VSFPVSTDWNFSTHDTIVAYDFSIPNPAANTASLLNATLGVFPPIPKFDVPSCGFQEGNDFVACSNEGQYGSAPLLDHDLRRWIYELTSLSKRTHSKCPAIATNLRERVHAYLLQHRVRFTRGFP
jgi:hypothetical protein